MPAKTRSKKDLEAEENPSTHQALDQPASVISEDNFQDTLDPPEGENSESQARPPVDRSDSTSEQASVQLVGDNEQRVFGLLNMNAEDWRQILAETGAAEDARTLATAIANLPEGGNSDLVQTLPIFERHTTDASLRRMIVELVKTQVEKAEELATTQLQLDELRRLRDASNMADHALQRKMAARTQHHDESRFGATTPPADCHPVVQQRKERLDVLSRMLCSLSGQDGHPEDLLVSLKQKMLNQQEEKRRADEKIAWLQEQLKHATQPREPQLTQVDGSGLSDMTVPMRANLARSHPYQASRGIINALDRDSNRNRTGSNILNFQAGGEKPNKHAPVIASEPPMCRSRPDQTDSVEEIPPAPTQFRDGGCRVEDGYHPTDNQGRTSHLQAPTQFRRSCRVEDDHYMTDTQGQVCHLNQ